MILTRQGSSKIIKTRYANLINLILSLDFTCLNQLQQTLHVCQFQQVCVSSNLLSLVKPVGESNNAMLFSSLFQGDPTKSKVTWSPYAQINEEKNIWCQWPGFG